MIVLLIVGLIKKTLYKMSQYFPKPYEPSGEDINVTVDLSNHATKDDIKNITHVFSTNYNKLVTKVDNIDTSGLVKKTDYNTKITEIEDKIPDTSNLATKYH